MPDFTMLDKSKLRVLLAESTLAINNRYLTVSSKTGKGITPNSLWTSRDMSLLPLRSIYETETFPGSKIVSNGSSLTQAELENNEILRENWDGFATDYFQELTRFSMKGKQQQRSIENGQVVVIHEKNQKRYTWDMARVVELHPDDQGVVRSVSLQRGGEPGKQRETIERAIQTLYPLESHAGQIYCDFITTNETGQDPEK